MPERPPFEIQSETVKRTLRPHGVAGMPGGSNVTSAIDPDFTKQKDCLQVASQEDRASPLSGHTFGSGGSVLHSSLINKYIIYYIILLKLSCTAFKAFQNHVICDGLLPSGSGNRLLFISAGPSWKQETQNTPPPRKQRLL